MNKDKFIEDLAKAIEKEDKEGKILPSLLLAQGILESAWGTSELAKKGNNLFGIKARADEPYVVKDTKEFLNNKWITVKANFRKYKDYQECIRHAIDRYLTMPRYSKIIEVKDYRAVCRLVWEAGYATDPKYPEKLINVIETYRLFEYDKDVNALNIIDVRGKVISHKSKRFAKRQLSQITAIAIHHSATATGNSDAFARYHVNTLDWPGVGYHYVILQDGTIEYCGDINTVRANVGGNNSYIIGICLVGNYGPNTMPPQRQLDSAYKLVEYLQLNITSIKEVKGHREFPAASSACPGFDMNKFREGFKNMNKKVETPSIDTPSAWAKEAWDWGKESKITDGTNPKGPITREQVVQMLYNFNKN